MQKQTEHGADRHGNVIGQSVVTQSFSPSGRRHDVDNQRVSSYRNHTERKSVHNAEDNK